MRASARKPIRASWRRFAFLAFTACAATVGWGGAARAEGGELFLRLTVANEAALLHDPGVTYRSGGSWAYVPRFGLAVTYGVAHWLSLGIGGDVSLPRDISAQNVVVQGLPPGTIAARYLGIMVPVRLGFHITQGGDWSAEIAVSGGPSFARWSVDEMRSASGALMPRNPFESWYTEWFGRLAVMAEWRPANWSAVSFGPYLGASTARDIYMGLVVEGALGWEIGPFFKSQ